MDGAPPLMLSRLPPTGKFVRIFPDGALLSGWAVAGRWANGCV